MAIEKTDQRFLKLPKWVRDEIVGLQAQASMAGRECERMWRALDDKLNKKYDKVTFELSPGKSIQIMIIEEDGRKCLCLHGNDEVYVTARAMNAIHISQFNHKGERV